MADKQVDKKMQHVSCNVFRRSGLFFFTCSVAVGASAVGIYYWLYSTDSKDGLVPSAKNFLCEKLGCQSAVSCGQWDSSWDKQALARLLTEDGPGNEDSTGNKRNRIHRNLIFVRHGQYHYHGKNDSERMLTEKGREQATHTGRRLREMGIKFDVIVHSTMRRAVETADLIAKELSLDSSTEISLSETDLLREGHPIVPVPYYGKSITSKDHERIEAAFANFFHRPPPSQTKETYELYVCHANVIRYLVLRALQLAPTAWLRFSIAHASITWISIRGDGVVGLSRMGDAGHIPVELETR